MPNATQKVCNQECEGFTGELWNPARRNDLYICRMHGYIQRPIWMPSPHAVMIGDACKFGNWDNA